MLSQDGGVNERCLRTTRAPCQRPLRVARRCLLTASSILLAGTIAPPGLQVWRAVTPYSRPLEHSVHVSDFANGSSQLAQLARGCQRHKPRWKIIAHVSQSPMFIPARRWQVVLLAIYAYCSKRKISRCSSVACAHRVFASVHEVCQ
jgi:hypothetical protein